jgi:hypothetical protein
MVKFRILRLSSRNLASKAAFSWVSVAVPNKSFKTREESSVADPDPLIRGMDPRIRIRIHPQNVMDPQHWRNLIHNGEIENMAGRNFSQLRSSVPVYARIVPRKHTGITSQTQRHSVVDPDSLNPDPDTDLDPAF